MNSVVDNIFWNITKNIIIYTCNVILNDEQIRMNIAIKRSSNYTFSCEMQSFKRQFSISSRDWGISKLASDEHPIKAPASKNGSFVIVVILVILVIAFSYQWRGEKNCKSRPYLQYWMFHIRCFFLDSKILILFSDV